MKSNLIIVIAMLLIGGKANSQFAFGVSPGVSMNSAYFGYKIKNRIVPFVGFQFFNTNANYVYSGQEFDQFDQLVNYENTYQYKLSLAIPNVGIKCFLIDKGKLKAHFLLNFTKPLLTGEVVENGIEDKDYSQSVSRIKIWGGELSFGAEYFFDDNFSLGGEFGLRYMHIGYEDSWTTSIYNPNTGMNQDSEVDYNFKFNMSPTFSRISLNFYF